MFEFIKAVGNAFRNNDQRDNKPPGPEKDQPSCPPITSHTDEPEDDKDGITHINIWNKAETDLGRWLYQSAKTPFVHPEFGPFNSVLGFWKWFVEEKPNDDFRYAYDGQVKTTAQKRNNKAKTRWIKDMKKVFLVVNYMKIIQNPEIKEAMINSTLPFREYYYHTGATVTIRINQRGQEWVCAMFEEIRSMLKEDRKPPEINWAEYRPQ